MNDNEPGNLEPSDLYLIHDGSLDLQPLFELAQDRRLVALAWDQRADPPTGSRVILYLTAERVRELVPLAIERQWQLGVLPHPEAETVTRALGVKGKTEAVFRHYLQTEAIEGAVLTCNGQVVFSSVVVGEVFGLRPYDVDQRPTRAGAFFRAVKATWDLRLRSYKLTTGKEQEIKLAALGMVVVENTQSPLIGRSFSEVLSISEGRLVLLALAPRSVLSYLWFLIRLLFPKKISLSRLPQAVGLIRTDRVLLEAPQGVDYSLDGELASAESIEFRILEQRARVLPGPEFVHRADQGPSKDIIRIKHLPVDETAREMVEKRLPFFTHASEEDHRDLFVALRGEAALTSPYLVLMILSVLLALTGLYANSAPVIIGAMILAPLMAPIVSLAMGLARMDPSLIRNSLRTMGIGIGAGLLCAVFVAWITPLENLTSEMRARLSPTLLDLGVAVISGIAGAYAHAKEEIAKSLAGVAIAVALVPPLSVAGIGLGWGDWVMARGALLLFITNLVGIALAGSLTFLVMGFAPFKLAKKGLAIALLLMAVVVGPLYIAFDDLVDSGEIMAEIPTGEIALAGQRVDLRIQEVQPGSPPVVRLILTSSEPMDVSHVAAVKQLIREHVGQDILVEAFLKLRQ